MEATRTVSGAVEELKALQRTLFLYHYASGVMYVDGCTVAPKQAADPRSEAMAELAGCEHRVFVTPQVGQLLAYLGEHANELDSQTHREWELLSEKYARETKIPEQELIESEQIAAKSAAVWERAKRTNDYALWEPYLAQMIDIQRRFAGYTDPDKHPYDAMLDQYEKGQSRETLDRFFSSLKTRLVPLLRAVVDSPVTIDDSFLFQEYPIAVQRKFTDRLMAMMRLDPQVCVVGESEHPFTCDLCREDTRITTHYEENNVISSLYSVVHEGGHACYGLGISPTFDRSILANGASMGIHESQSRFFENIIGRSKPFIHALYPTMRELFPLQLLGVSEEKLWQAVNKVQPSLIRTEADELTYSLHVLVRYELEKQLIEGTLSTRDLPEAWNTLYHEILGVEVPDDTHGVLQDSHWGSGSFGYFPTYALGSAYGAQLLAAMQKELNIAESVAEGNLQPVQDWLKEHIWQYGQFYRPSQLLEKACGAPFSPQYYIDYLTLKYAELYQL